ncbi:MAG: DUF565 domain-containing protein [Cyanobacteria bacterium P01_H01_bin.119]
MQNTRLNTLVTVTGDRLREWLINPWRRVSLSIISLLLGNFFAIAVSSVAGQTADLDIVLSLILLLFVELINRLVYRRSQRSASDRAQQKSLPLSLLNAFKIGLVYGLFVEGFKLAS